MKPVALVTGGSRGIGLGISTALAENGYDVAVNGMREEKQVTETLDRLRESGARIIYCRGDVGDSEARKQILGSVRENLGQLNLLVNNAGVAPRERLDPLQDTEESFDRLMRINLKGPYFLTQAAADWMIEQKKSDETFRAAIVNIGSISATMVSINRADYCMSKAGFAMMSRVWAVKLAEYGIPVYEVRPGITRTDMTSGVQEKYDKLIADGLLVQSRWGEIEDVGKSVALLARSDLPYSTGQVLMVDGGLTIPRL